MKEGKEGQEEFHGVKLRLCALAIGNDENHGDLTFDMDVFCMMQGKFVRYSPHSSGGVACIRTYYWDMETEH